MKTQLKLRMSQADAHYGGNLVDGARLLSLFGDVATELLIMNDGDEGLFRAYETVDFLHPVYAGDFLLVEGEIIYFGNTSRKMKFSAYKTIEALPALGPTKARVLDEKLLVCQAVGTCIVLADKR